ncbi:MAG: carboxypeptidase-like regulatory domain-containing protein [Bryobacteraceae bacterium]
MNRVSFICLVALLLSLVAVPGRLSAQTATAQITGTVTDSSGAVVPGAKVTVASQLTGTTRSAVTSTSGDYVVPLLPVGVYSVSVEQQGFRTVKRTDIPLNVNQVARIDLDMSVGQVTETVQVQANAVAVDTETSSVGSVVTEKQITQLPLNGRNFLQLLFLGNGAVETNGEQGSMRQGAGNAISINGSRPTSNNYLLDGSSNTDTALGTPAAILSVDAIQEFKEQTATYSAEYGFSANQVNIVSKSGTNDLHGSVFWFLRNDALDASTFFNNLAGRPKNKLRQNQPGFVAGGPVYLPKIYNGRNKTFWLANYEGRRTRTDFRTFGRSGSDQLADATSGSSIRSRGSHSPQYDSAGALLATGQTGSGEIFPPPMQLLGNYIRSRSIPSDTDQYTFAWISLSDTALLAA